MISYECSRCGAKEQCFGEMCDRCWEEYDEWLKARDRTAFTALRDALQSLYRTIVKEAKRDLAAVRNWFTIFGGPK